MRLNSKFVQAGVGSDTATGAVSTPIYQSATFRHPALGQSTGYDYSRTKNPTRQALENAMATLENGHSAYAFASGMAAITAVLMLFKSGDNLIVSDDLYGGTYRVFEKIFNRFNITATYIDTSDLKLVEKSVKKNTKALLIETPTNPLMKITDLKGVAEIGKKFNLITIVDNTFLSPYLQRPLDFGCDISLHSATKYLGGHNDVVAGIVIARKQELAEKIAFIQNSTGAILQPFDSWLLLRGLKTLPVRIEKAQSNAKKLAKWLQNHHLVTKVYYPDLEEHEGYKINKKQAKGGGAMLSFRVKHPDIVRKVLEGVKLISFAESLGGVESLITYPAVQTHADIPEKIRKKIGVTDDLLRLSVGIEDWLDLKEDLNKAIIRG